MEVQAVMELHQALQVHQSLTQVAVQVVHLLVVTEVVPQVLVVVEEEQMVLVDQMEQQEQPIEGEAVVVELTMVSLVERQVAQA
jgi:hypothetical protein